MSVQEEPVRGVVDRFEGDLAVVVLDDGQQLDWPRAALSDDVRPGVAVVLSLVAGGRFHPCAEEEEEAPAPEAATGWQAELAGGSEAEGWTVRTADGQTLRWTGGGPATAQLGALVRLQLTPDFEDTRARRARVASLLDDIFGSEE